MALQTFEAPAVTADDQLAQSERDRATLYLEQTRKGITGALRNVSEPMWQFKPAGGGWSIAQILDHIIFVQDLVLGPVHEKLEAAPAMAMHPDYKLIDDTVIYQIP